MNIVACAFYMVFMPLSLSAGEGMWLPQLLKALNEKEMKSMGMKLSAEDIYSINKGSLKDAIVHFGGFCTSEIISSEGLLLTNHHCGYGQIQSHSTVENNLIKNGFWAKSHQEELPNPGLSATFIERIDDVTTQALRGITPQMTPQERQSNIDKNIQDLKEKYTLSPFQKIIVKPFYDGNQYFSFITITYPDVRLVGAPPESIGKFGSDTDNWVWPRHTGDFSLFRIYADKNNNPAEYNSDNIPFTPKHFLPISMDGVSEGDFTMIFGFPGRTNQYLPSIAIEQIINTLNPAKIAVRDISLKIMDRYMRNEPAIKIKYASKYASIANYWKKWIGEKLGLEKTDAVSKKRQFEKEFLVRAQAKGKYQSTLNSLEDAYIKINELALARDYFGEIAGRNVELTGLAIALKSLVNAYEKNGAKAYEDQLLTFRSRYEGFYKDFDNHIDQEKFAALLDYYVSHIDQKYVPDYLKKNNLGMTEDESYAPMIADQYLMSFLSDESQLQSVLAQKPDEAVVSIKRDPFYALIIHWYDFYNDNIASPYNEIKNKIDVLQAEYTKAQLELFPERRFYPDANSTMRVTYGQVKGYKPRDAVQYEPYTYLDGIIEKYVPGDYEFDLDEKFLTLYKNKDYGPYTAKNGKVPVCFLGSNHTTGGNSGSPAIDAYGNLIGLNFDRVWEGTMSDINYDVSICRNIMVDARYILWVIDKYAGAHHLIEEMSLVYPKSKKKTKSNKKKSNK